MNKPVFFFLLFIGYAVFSQPNDYYETCVGLAGDELKQELVQHVRNEIGSFASPDIIQWAPGLPKTRSGKIMRRILRKIATNEIDNLGDTSTLAEPEVVNGLIENRENK